MPFVTINTSTAMSPSTRRAWIEIERQPAGAERPAVALHPEGVDRNKLRGTDVVRFHVALHPEGVDRN